MSGTRVNVVCALSLALLTAAVACAEIRRPPRSAFVTLTNATFEEPGGREATLSDLEMLAKGGYDLLLMTLRCRPDLNAPEVRDLVRRVFARAKELGIEVCFDIDPRIARAQFLKEHPEDVQQVLRFVTAQPTDGVAAVTLGRLACGDHMTGGTRPYDTVSNRFLRAWAIRRLADGTVSAREVAATSSVTTDGIAVMATGLAEGEELAVLQQSDLFCCDVFSPHLLPYTRRLMDDYRALGADGAFRDEWGFPPSFLPGQEERRTFWYSRHYADAYRRETGRDLMDDALLFAFPLAGHSAAERSKAITAYMRLNWGRNSEIETDFYETVHRLFGSKSYVAKHPTWFPVIGWREALHNGLHWWRAKRDFAQTDETTPIAAACGLTKKAGGSVWLNEGYQTNAMLYAGMVWRYAAAGGRMVFHQVYPPWVGRYKGMPPLRKATERHRDIIREASRARDSVALMDRLSDAPIDCPVAWIFSHRRVIWDWTDAAYGDWGDRAICGLWAQGWAVDAYPSTELEAMSVGPDGYLRMGRQRYRAVVLRHFSNEDRAAFAKLTAGGRLRTRVFTSDEGVAAYLASLPDAVRQIPMAGPYVDNARQPLGEWVPQLPAADGVLSLTDGTRIRLKATANDREGDPISGELTLADGTRFSYEARGWFGANAKKVGGAGVTRIHGAGIDVSYPTPQDVILDRRTANGAHVTESPDSVAIPKRRFP